MNRHIRYTEIAARRCRRNRSLCGGSSRPAIARSGKVRPLERKNTCNVSGVVSAQPSSAVCRQEREDSPAGETGTTRRGGRRATTRGTFASTETGDGDLWGPDVSLMPIESDIRCYRGEGQAKLAADSTRVKSIRALTTDILLVPFAFIAQRFFELQQFQLYRFA